MRQFHSHYWPTTKPIIEELWAHGHQTLFYAEGDWNAHLDSFAELPDRSIVYHADRADIFEIHRKIGHKFCLSGGIPNYLLAIGTPKEVRGCCKKVIEGVAKDGGYIMDASAIIQNDATVENIRAMTDATREHGVYSSGSSRAAKKKAPPAKREAASAADIPAPKVKPGICIPWEQKAAELPGIPGDKELVRRIWEDIEGLGNMFIWQCLVSF
jgi:hypothetical protein